ncbi:FimV/HubP family polar landmark protein [Tepidiphilus margaritifer]|uniref:FimV/HubP family polar landmark protein n=1 Tax=Tepidiphilus margaritifer TaxID=203471 RepID=UPI00041DCBBB|nr:FimV/HubP family polar landmark protein [Tepidiphilus margaritifer]
MKRTRQVPLALLLGALWGNAWSAGFGELIVRSRLGEPLTAEITVKATPEELRSLSARIAPPEYFREVGVPYNATTQAIEAKLVRDGNRAKIVLTSRTPIREPFVDVLLDMNWAGGRLVREFAILLDPPEVAAPARPVPAIGKNVIPSPTTAVRQTPGQWTVQSGDTLYAIARQVAPSGATTEQTLVALWRANSNAFIDGDINRLKVGATLKVPSSEEIRRIPLAEARSMLRVPSKSRHAAVAAAPARETGPAPEASADKGKVVAREALESPSPAPAEDRLKVGAAPEAGAGTETKSPAIPSPETAALQESLSASEAALGEANERIVKLETEIARLQKLLEAQNATLARLQAQAETSVKQSEASWGDALLPAVGGAAAALLAMFGWSAYRRRREEKAALSISPSAAPTTVTPETPAVTTMEHSGPVTESGRAVTSGQNIDTSSILGTDFTQVAFNALHADEGVDPVAEAEVYLAYGRDPQAEEILLDALKQNPRRAAIYLKLLEVYAKRGDRAKFDQYLKTLSDLTGEQGPDWTMALAIGQRAWPQDERFATVVVTDTLEPPESLVEKAEEATSEPRNASAPAPAAAVSAEPAATAPQADFVDLDFDLDKLTEQMTAEPKPAPTAATPAPAEEALEFDLELPPVEEETTRPPQVSPAASAPAQAPAPASASAAESLEFPELSLDEGAVTPQEERPAPSPAAVAESQELKSMLEEIDFDLAEISPEIEAPSMDQTTQARMQESSEVTAASAEAQRAAEVGPPTEVMDIDLERFASEAGATDHDTRLQLAQAYFEMGDTEGARELLEEVLRDGNEAQRAAAQQLMDKIQGSKA